MCYALVDVNAVSCNCSNFPATDNVLLPPVDETPERGNSPQPPARNDDVVDATNVNELEESDEDHWFSDESEGVIFVNNCNIFYMFILHYFGLK